MPVHLPFVFADEDALEGALNALDAHQRRAIPALQARLLRRPPRARVAQALVANAQQLALQAPTSLLRAAAGQLHQARPARAVLPDALYLGLKQQARQLDGQVLTLLEENSLRGAGAALARALPLLRADAQALAQELVVSPLANRAVERAVGAAERAARHAGGLARAAARAARALLGG